jgi:sugar phosphate isomerase/epimerase
MSDQTQDEKPNDRAGTPESAAEFRAFLAEIGATQSGFARTLRRLGDDRAKATIVRHVERMATGAARISGPMRVIMSVFRNSHRKRLRRAATATATPARADASGVSGAPSIQLANLVPPHSQLPRSTPPA